MKRHGAGGSEIETVNPSPDSTPDRTTFSFYPCWDLGGAATWHYDNPARSKNWDPGPEIVLTRDPGNPSKVFIEGIGWLQSDSGPVDSAQVFVDLHFGKKIRRSAACRFQQSTRAKITPTCLRVTPITSPCPNRYHSVVPPSSAITITPRCDYSGHNDRELCRLVL